MTANSNGDSLVEFTDKQHRGASSSVNQFASSSSSSSSAIRSSSAALSNMSASPLYKTVGSAVFYGVASFLITVVNKTVLTTYKFPSFLVLSIGQMAASILVLGLGKQMRIIAFPDLDRDTGRKLFPLPLIYLGNMMFGLGGTQALSLPMFAALRRFSILMTMLLELRILGVRPSTHVQISVYSMVGGALLAASDDLSFNLNVSVCARVFV